MTSPFRPRFFLPGIFGANVSVAEPFVVSPLASPGNGPIAGYTNVFDFNLVNFDWVTWHNYEWQNWVQVDALLNTAIGFLNIRGIWRPLTLYTVGDGVYDPEDVSKLYRSQDDHTSSTDFQADILAGHWTQVTSLGPPVESVFGRLGDVVALEGDYSAFFYTKAQTYTKTEVDASQAAQNAAQDTRDDSQDTQISAAQSAAAAANTNANSRVLKAGDTMTGPLVLSGAPTIDLHPATKKYTDDKNVTQDAGILSAANAAAAANANANTRVAKAGDTMTGFLTLHADPTATMHTANKRYVDNVAGASGGPFLPLAGGTLTGNLLIENTGPQIAFHETDSAPNIYYRFIAAGSGNFYLQSAPDAAFASATNLWRYNQTQFDFYKGVSLSGTVGASTASLKIDASYPSIWFADNTPSGSYPDLMLTAGNSTMRFSAVDADGGNASAFLVASPLEVSTVPNTKLATAHGGVEIGYTGAATINLKRTVAPGYNYITVPDGAQLRITNASGVAWATVNGATGWVAGSDARLKENIADIGYGLDTIMALRAVEFDWIESGVHDIGFIAQEVEPIVPEVVEEQMGEEDKDSTYMMRKDALVAVLVKAVQELTLRVQALEAAP